MVSNNLSGCLIIVDGETTLNLHRYWTQITIYGYVKEEFEINYLKALLNIASMNILPAMAPTKGRLCKGSPSNNCVWYFCSVDIPVQTK